MCFAYMYMGVKIIRSPESAGVTDSCEALEEHPSLLTTKPSLQPQEKHF